MRAQRLQTLVSVALLFGAAGCELIAGLEDHNLVSDTSPDASGDGSTSGEASTAPGFTITDVPALTLQQGDSAVVNVTITRENGFADAISITVSGLPAGATTTPLSITGSQSTGTFTIALAATTPQSLSHLSIDGATVDGKVSASAKMDLIVRGPPGSLDLLYGTQGAFMSTAMSASGAAIDANDNLLLVGSAAGSDLKYNLFAAMRVLPNGAADTAFGGGLVSQVHPGFNQALFPAVFPIATGDIVYAGTLDALTAEYLRVTPAGAFDPAFSPDAGVGYEDDGLLMLAFAIDASGRVVSAGRYPDATDNTLYLERRTTSGALDATFPNGTRRVGTAAADAAAVAVQSDGKIVTLCTAVDTHGQGLALNRFTSDGAADPTFGVNGYVAPFPNTIGTATAILIQSDGSILALGSYDAGGSFIARYSGAGNLDVSFGFVGVATIPDAGGLVLQSDGKIIAAGTVTGDDAGTFTDFQLERLSNAGVPDPTFGANGFVQSAFGAPSVGGSSYRAIAIQSDGRILFIGTTQLTKTSSELTVARYWP